MAGCWPAFQAASKRWQSGSITSCRARGRCSAGAGGMVLVLPSPERRPARPPHGSLTHSIRKGTPGPSRRLVLLPQGADQAQTTLDGRGGTAQPGGNLVVAVSLHLAH